MTIPPHSEEHERAVLSTILMDGAASLSQALDAKISEACFFVPTHRKVWRSILWLHSHGKPLELSVLAEELKKGGKLEEIGGYEALVATTRDLPSSATYAYSVEKLRELNMLRQLITIADDTKEKAIGYSGSVDDFVAKVTEALALKNDSETAKTLEQVVDDVAAACLRIIKGEASDADVGLEFPWASWNNTLGPAQGGELIFIAARPGIGKSSCARQIAWKWAQKYGDVLYFSHEMTQRAVVTATAQTLAGVSYRALKRRELPAKEAQSYLAALETIKQAKRLHIYDRDQTFSQLMSRVQAAKQIRKVRAIFCDYLQILDPLQDRGETRDIAIGRMSKGFKALANSMDIPVVVLSQISRTVERDNRLPRLSDLRESGNIEQDADRVIFLHAPAENKHTGQTQDLNDGTLSNIHVEAIQAKGRGDGQHTVEMMFHRPTTTFNDMSYAK